MSLQIGAVIDGKYKIVRLLGEGGMGAVFEAKNTFINRTVAIKVLHATVSGADEVVKRFEREAKAAGCIGSDHILEVLDLGSLDSGDRYMVLEYLDGETVAERIARKGTIGEVELAGLLKQALAGLGAAHAAGIVHRDLKPDNVFILKEKAGRPDFVKLIDFGISKFGNLTGDMAMTATNAVMGTPFYMSPEQAKGVGGVDHQSDIYSIGVIAFEAITGKVPFDGKTFNDLMFKIVLNELPELTEVAPGTDPAFANIIKRALAKEKSERFESAEQFAQALESWTPGAATVIGGTDAAVQAKGGLGPIGATGTSWAKTQTGIAAEAQPLVVPKSKMSFGLGAVALGGVAVLGALAYFLLGNPEKEPEAFIPTQSDGLTEASTAQSAPTPSAGAPTGSPASDAPPTEKNQPEAESAKDLSEEESAEKAANAELAKDDKSGSVVAAPPVVEKAPAASPPPRRVNRKPVVRKKPAAKPTPKKRDFGY